MRQARTSTMLRLVLLASAAVHAAARFEVRFKVLAWVCTCALALPHRFAAHAPCLPCVALQTEVLPSLSHEPKVREGEPYPHLSRGCRPSPGKLS